MEAHYSGVGRSLCSAMIATSGWEALLCCAGYTSARRNKGDVLMRVCFCDAKLLQLSVIVLIWSCEGLRVVLGLRDPSNVNLLLRVLVLPIAIRRCRVPSVWVIALIVLRNVGDRVLNIRLFLATLTWPPVKDVHLSFMWHALILVHIHDTASVLIIRSWTKRAE